MRSTRATMPSIRSTTAVNRGASSLIWLIVSLNRSSVASRLPVELLRSTRVSLNPSKMASTCSTVTSALSAARASLRIRSVPVRAPGLAAVVCHDGHYDHTVGTVGADCSSDSDVKECGGDTPSRQCKVNPRRRARGSDLTTRATEYAQGFSDGETDCRTIRYGQT